MRIVFIVSINEIIINIYYNIIFTIFNRLVENQKNFERFFYEKSVEVKLLLISITLIFH